MWPGCDCKAQLGRIIFLVELKKCMCVLIIIIIIQGIPVASLLDLVSLRGIKHAAVSRPRSGVVTAGVTKAYSFTCIKCGL